MIGRNDCFRPGWNCLRNVVKEEQAVPINSSATKATVVPSR